MIPEGKPSRKLAIQLGARSAPSTPGSAVAEIISLSDSSSVDPVRIRLGINQVEEVPVTPGSYTVRVYLPNGNVVAESVSVSSDDCSVDFELPVRVGLFAEEALVGVLPRLPNADRADALGRYGTSLDDPEVVESGKVVIGPRQGGAELTRKVRLEELSSRVLQAAEDVRKNYSSIQKLGGRHALSRVQATAWTLSDHGQVEQILGLSPAQREVFAKRDLQALEAWLVGGFTEAEAFAVQDMGENDAKLSLARQTSDDRFLNGEQRGFATVVDSQGDAHVAVFPRDWRRYSGQSAGSSLLVALDIDTVLRDENDPSERARWRCSPLVDDPDFNSYMGFLTRGMTEAAEVMLRQATEMLYEKMTNPVAAAAGAFGLLLHSDDQQSAKVPWRRWIDNLNQRAPALPDAAVAKARMYWRYGTSEARGELDVEVLRGLALEAVDRGLPYLTVSVGLLSEMLSAVMSDDRANNRSLSDLAERTASAYRKVTRLSRLMVPGEFFTVVRLPAHGDWSSG